MIILPISLTIAAGAALVNLWLSIRVGRVRTKEKVFVGDGGNELVTRRMRAHSNFVENTAFVLILLALVELGIGSSMWLWGVGALYLVGRILHAIGMDGMMWGRMVGTIITMLTQLGLALGALAQDEAVVEPGLRRAEFLGVDREPATVAGDRARALLGVDAPGRGPARRRGVDRQHLTLARGQPDVAVVGAVSYTHLTLPTKRIV